MPYKHYMVYYERNVLDIVLGNLTVKMDMHSKAIQ